MKKDRIRDYATEAFRDYAKISMLNGISESQIQDIKAVRQTIEHFRHRDAEIIIDAVKAVYFTGASERLGRKDISLRVSRFAVEQYVDESTVYRYLREARRIFAHFRGLTP